MWSISSRSLLILDCGESRQIELAVYSEVPQLARSLACARGWLASQCPLSAYGRHTGLYSLWAVARDRALRLPRSGGDQLPEDLEESLYDLHLL